MRKGRLFITFLVIIGIILGGAYAYTYFFLNNLSVKGGAEGYPVPENRVNILVMGVAKGLSDTNMLCSFDPKNHSLDVYSIPRDTYYLRKGHNSGAQKKINSSYGSGGADAMVKSVSGLTKVKIHYYVKIDYEAVKAIVDAIGGIPVTVEENMNYDDPADDLHIHFKKGDVVSKGDDIIKVLRWRKNNHGKGGYAEGDIGRIKMQQQVVKLGVEKLLSGNLVANYFKLQAPIKKYVKTNMTPEQMMFYITKAKKIEKEKITLQTIPGAAKTISGLSFYVPNDEKMKALFKTIKDGEK